MSKASVTCGSHFGTIKIQEMDNGVDRSKASNEKTMLTFPRGWQHEQRDRAVLKRVSHHYPDIRRGIFPTLEMVAEVIEGDNQHCADDDDEGDEGIIMKCPQRRANPSQNGRSKQAADKLAPQRADVTVGVLTVKNPHGTGHPTPPDSNVEQRLASHTALQGKPHAQEIGYTGLISPPATPEEMLGKHPYTPHAFENYQLQDTRFSPPLQFPNEVPLSLLEANNMRDSNDGELLNRQLVDEEASPKKTPEETQQQNFAPAHGHALEPPVVSSNTIDSNSSSLTQIDNQTQTSIAPCRIQEQQSATACNGLNMLQASCQPVVQRGFDCPPENFIRDHFTPLNRRRRIEIVDSWTAWPIIEGFNWNTKWN